MTAISPAIVAILSRFFLKEQLGNIEWFLIALIIGSIVVIQVIEEKTKTKKEEKQEAGLILYSQGKNILFDFKPLIESWNKVDQALQIFNIEKNKLRKA